MQTLHAAGADVQYVSIPSNGRWYDHIGIKKIDVKLYIKIHSTVVDNGGKIYDLTNKDYEKYVVMLFILDGKVGFTSTSKLQDIWMVMRLKIMKSIILK